MTIKDAPSVHLRLANGLFFVRVALTDGGKLSSGDATTANKAGRSGLLVLRLGLLARDRRRGVDPSLETRVNVLVELVVSILPMLKSNWATVRGGKHRRSQVRAKKIHSAK